MPFIPKSVSAKEVEFRRKHKRQIYDKEKSMPVCEEGDMPKNGELPYVCEEGKKRQAYQASMTEGKRQYMKLEDKVDGQIPFLAKKGEECKYGQIPAFGDNPGDENLPYDGRIIPHGHSMDGKCTIIHKTGECFMGKKSLGKHTEEEWTDREVKVLDGKRELDPDHSARKKNLHEIKF